MPSFKSQILLFAQEAKLSPYVLKFISLFLKFGAVKSCETGAFLLSFGVLQHWNILWIVWLVCVMMFMFNAYLVFELFFLIAITVPFPGV